MGSAAVHYDIVTDTYRMRYEPADGFPGMDPEGTFSDGVTVPDGDWTAFVSPFYVGQNSGIGIILELESGELLELLAHAIPPQNTESTVYVQYPDQQFALRVECEAGVLRYSYSENYLADWVEVANFSPASPVTEVGIVLRYDRPEYAATGFLTQVTLLQGIWQNAMEEVWLGEPDELVLPTQRDTVEIGVLSTAEPIVHAIVGAQFGDLEFDVGKSVRWITWFTDTVFVLDVNLGTPRYWIVNWAETFPDSEHAVTGTNYFYDAKAFRKEQWDGHRKAFGEPDNSDWVLFIDGHEGLSVDNRSLPNDYSFAPFKSFLWREIQRAQGLGQNYAILPYYVFLRSGNITNISYATASNDPAGNTPSVMQAMSVPYYQAYMGQKRLWNVGALRDPNFDWSQIDTPVAPSANAKAQIISYGYAHWNLQDIVPPATVVPPLDANNDDGWRMRNLLSRVRPVPGLPVGGTWIPQSSDPAGLPGPWAGADTNNPRPIHPLTEAPLSQPVAPNAALVGLLTPLYDCVFRINMRDGVWYEAGVSGNIPLKWDDVQQKWITEYVPAQWSDQGVDAHDPYYVAP